MEGCKLITSKELVVSKSRDVRLDTIRGFAILTVISNHLSDAISEYGYKGRVIPTLTYYGYSSAAEIFVAMSGYMIGLIFFSRSNIGKRLLVRACYLLIVNLVLFLTVAVVSATISPEHYGFWRLQPFFNSPIKASVEFVEFKYAPRLVDILQLYVILLIISPPVAFVASRSRGLVCLMSVSLYLAVQFRDALPSSFGLFLEVGITFNVCAWQLIFVLPMLLGQARLHESLFDSMRQNKVTMVILFVVLCVSAVVHHYPKAIVISDILTSRQNLGIVRLAHAVVVLLFLCGITAYAVRRFEIPVSFLSLLGRNSLKVFVISIPVTYVLAEAWSLMNIGGVGYFLCFSVLLLLSLVVADQADRSRVRQR